MLDSHAHLNFDGFKQDYPEVIARSQAGGMEAIINVGAQFQSSAKAVAIANEHKICFASAGVHPIHWEDTERLSDQEILVRLKKLAQAKKVVAIGETGLDYFHLPKDKKERAKAIAQQKRLFGIHLDVCRKTKLALILHCRDAYKEMLAILAKAPIKRGVIHCFCGDLDTAQKFLTLGFYIGFTGLITYPGNEYLKEVISAVPLEKILVETDCPYLPPQPMRGKRNEPLFVRYVLEHIAKVKGLTFGEVEIQTSKNAVKLFKLRQ